VFSSLWVQEQAILCEGLLFLNRGVFPASNSFDFCPPDFLILPAFSLQAPPFLPSRGREFGSDQSVLRAAFF